MPAQLQQRCIEYDHGKEPVVEKVTQPMGPLPFVLFNWILLEHKADVNIALMLQHGNLLQGGYGAIFAAQHQSTSLARTWVTLESEMVA